MSRKTETEAKFVIPDLNIFTTLQTLDMLGSFQLSALSTQTVVDQYVDTVDKRIFQANYACRIRDGETKKKLTLKALTAATSHIHARLEIEAVIVGDTLAEWGDSEAKRTLLEITQSEPIQPWFTIYQTRQKIAVLSDEQQLIELSLDAVSYQAGSATDYYELEAELTDLGTEADLLTFVTALQQRWSLQPQPQSKFERALALNQ
ncbi:CYTH domain-containing protein [Anaerolineales bacterium HSG6]|nr:CYTH domain-containing protein [Anaerolineales bacterium HSG6]MDM8532931.1 CYTH domain-containing protein [Anaerolineales bacterium HSG25]